MKKLLLICCLLLVSCSPKTQSQYYLYIYYAKTCPVCRSLINNVVPLLEEKYDDSMNITMYDIDEEESMDAYAKTCSLLDGYVYTENSGSIPFLVLDGYFAKVGYDIGSHDQMLQAIEDAINGKDVSQELKEVYYFKDGLTFHKGGF